MQLTFFFYSGCVSAGDLGGGNLMGRSLGGTVLQRGNGVRGDKRITAHHLEGSTETRLIKIAPHLPSIIFTYGVRRKFVTRSFLFLIRTIRKPRTVGRIISPTDFLHAHDSFLSPMFFFSPWGRGRSFHFAHRKGVLLRR
jgi:hypothetical protein